MISGTSLKRTDATFIFSHITKLVNLLNDANTPKKDKRDSIESLYKFIVADEPCIKSMIIQEILISFNKSFIKLSLFDSIDKVREFSLKILIHLYSNCTNATKFFPFIFSALVDKLECSDLEGVSDLPEDMRPTPSQKPHKVNKLTESCEEIRELYVKLLESLIFNNDESEVESMNMKTNDDFRMFIQDLVNIARTLCMDPCINVVLATCKLIKEMSKKFGKDLLFYFNSILSRAVYYPLTHKQSKLRLAALDCLEQLLYCSPYKKNVEIMEQLIGFRDPNIVPIKDFYEPTTKLNYLALLISDPSLQVVKRFYEMITNWLLYLEDRFDHEARLIPYLLSGLFDPSEEICLYTCERLELIGLQYEIDNEKEIREDRQYSIDSPWVNYCTSVTEIEGKVFVEFDKNLYYPFPLCRRPNFGARLLVRKYLRRYIKNLCKEYDSIEDSIKVRVSNLILFSIAYGEDAVIEYLDQIFLAFQRELIKPNGDSRSDKSSLIDPMTKSLRLLGRFCDYESMTKLIFPTIVGDLNGNYPDIQKGGLICLKFVLQGHLESLSNKKFGFGIFNQKLEFLFEVLDNKRFIDYLDSSTAIELIDFYSNLLDTICKMESVDNEDLKQVEKNFDLVFDHLIQALGALAIFDLHGVSNVELVNQVEKKLDIINKNIMKIISKCKQCDVNSEIISSSASSSASFFSYKVKTTLGQIEKYVENNHLTLNNKQYKIFFIFLKQIKLFLNGGANGDLNNEDDKEIIKLSLRIFSKIFKSGYNFSIHQDTIKLLSGYLNQSPININSNSDLLLSVLEELVNLFSVINNPYENVENEKFKFADLLKDEKEVLKKKLKSPKAIKSDIREKALLLIKALFNKNEIFSINSQHSKDSIKFFLKVFSNDNIKEFIREKESNRKLFIDLYYLFLVKFFSIFKVKINLKENRPTELYPDLKEIINNFEEFFPEEIYDSILEVRQMCLNIFNVILCSFETSQYFDPMCGLFSSFYEEKDLKKFNFESLKVLAYLEEENKKVDLIFKSYKSLFSIILNLYIDEKVSFGNLCEGIMKNSIEKFPIFTFNEFTKARTKNQMTRIEVLEKMFIKFLKK